MGFFENIFGDNAEIAYKEGVEQVSGVKTIYVDPDMFEDALESIGIDYDNISAPDLSSALTWIPQEKQKQFTKEMGEILEKNLEEEQPGITKAMLDKAKELVGVDVSIGAIAVSMASKGPLTVDNITLNGETYGLAVLPAEFIDTKEESIAFLTGNEYDSPTLNTIIGNMPGSDEDWAKIIGFHEGGHLEGKDTGKGSVNILQDEVTADRRAIAEALAEAKRGHDANDFPDDGDSYEFDSINPDVALAFKDLRALRDGSNDPEHATGPLIDSGDPASSLHIAIANTYRQNMLDEVDENFDFKSFEGSATNAQELLQENPDEFFKTVNKGLDDLRTEAVDEYNKDPSSFETKAGVVGAQILTDYINDYEDAYKRRVLGQDTPERTTSAQFIPQTVEDGLYTELKHKNALSAVEESHKNEAMSTYHTSDAFEGFDWEAYKGKAEDMSALLKENPGVYYTAKKDHLENLRTDAQEQYAAEPSQKNLEHMIEIEHVIDFHGDGINTGLSMNIGDDAPQMSTESFVPEDLKHEFYEQRLNEKEAEASAKETADTNNSANTHLGIDDPNMLKKAEGAENTALEPATERNGDEFNGGDRLLNIEPDKGYEQGIDGTAYTTEVDMKEAGEPTVDFENGVSVGGTPVTNFFAQNADPSPEDVTLVNAVSPETYITTDMPIPPTVEAYQTVKALS